MATDPRVCVCPGTYDPVTNGHLDVIARAAQLFDVVVVGVVDRSTRKSPLFTSAERIDFIEQATAEIGNVRVERFDTLVVDFARSVGARSIIKGLRAISDFEYEMEMAQLNRNQAADIESVYLMSGPQYSFLRSSGVKELATFGGEIEALVPAPVAALLKERLAR